MGTLKHCTSSTQIPPQGVDRQYLSFKERRKLLASVCKPSNGFLFKTKRLAFALECLRRNCDSLQIPSFPHKHSEHNNLEAKQYELFILYRGLNVHVRIVQLSVSNKGISYVLERSVNVLFTVRQTTILQYVLSLCYMNRIVQTALTFQYATNDLTAHAKVLDEALEDIRLPVPAVKYLNTIGVFQSACGLFMGPYCAGYKQLFPHNGTQIIPHVLLERLGRPKPDNYWCIDHFILNEWNDLAKNNIGYKSKRIWHANNCQGNARMLVSYTDRLITIQAHSPEMLSTYNMKLGALYRFRDYSIPELWHLKDNVKQLSSNFELKFNALDFAERNE